MLSNYTVLGAGVGHSVGKIVDVSRVEYNFALVRLQLVTRPDRFYFIHLLIRLGKPVRFNVW